ncbi:DNA/RNA non-specific endonuclease [Methylobacterium oxalidis]|uniref:DNA/RNA non-specific endonuclease n=1 Tax=Methylobacterium oxalidis TaxID=944322 RepID=UPI00331577A2
MSKPEETLARLRGLNEEIQRQDPPLREESMDTRTREEVVELPRGVRGTDDAIQEESIVLRRLRPVMAIKNNTTELVFADAGDSQVWKERLTGARDNLDRAIRSVGRVELRGGRLDWVGTGWLVAENVLVTNRHVANEFARRSGEGFKFRTGADGPISARTDFLQEIGNPDTLEFKLLRPLHVEEEPGPDVAFFEIELTSGDAKLAGPIKLAEKIGESAGVAIIGYPAYDSRIPEPDLMERLYGSVYDKKRLAPGAVTRLERARLLHNCTTLGGNSGSVLLDLDSGEAVGLHFSGSFLATNYAVRADVVADLLRRIRSGRLRREEGARAPSGPRSSPRNAVSPKDGAAGSVSVTIPLTITVSLGTPQGAEGEPRRRWSAAPRPAEDGDVDGEEGRASDYRDRQGYQQDFLGEDLAVELPTVERAAADVLEFELDGASEHVLRYEHYSVVMSRSRRMCFFSAVNIDGKLSRKSGRVAWKWDPRIPKSQQIMNECYGNPPKFSRGHMTRREDPGWGDADTAKRGNEDSMHVTNTTPQMQAFNAPIWLALEDYALQHARQDEMRISVFTGPYFCRRDPTMHGVRIPLAFWKIIAFIHDDTGELCATGYEMDQEQSLPSEDEFVFGAFRSPQLNVATQVPIRSIEARSGLSFGSLASADPLAGEHEGLAEEIARTPLLALEQIRFVQ